MNPSANFELELEYIVDPLSVAICALARIRLQTVFWQI